jgi:hypothetical protein
MKKPTNRKNTRPDLPVISITATLAEAELLKTLIERLAGQNNAGRHIPESFKPGWNTFRSSSIEAFVSGDINVTSEADVITKPFVKSFLFTCINAGSNGNYSLVWGSSLS